MALLREIAQKVRSKNAGPFWVTIDIFCGTNVAYDQVQSALNTQDIAARFNLPLEKIRRFDMPELNVVKFSIPRPVVQGDSADRDMHGASFAIVLAEMDI